jgi:hypothetical protein
MTLVPTTPLMFARVLFVAAATCLTGCSAHDASSPPHVVTLQSLPAAPSLDSDPADPVAARAAYETCMTKEGAGAEPPGAKGSAGPSSGTGARAEWDAADTKCSHFISNIRGDDPPPVDRTALLAWAECMRQHGVPIPDPEFDGNGLPVKRDLGIDPNTAQFHIASAACEQGPVGSGTVGG